MGSTDYFLQPVFLFIFRICPGRCGQKLEDDECSTLFSRASFCGYHEAFLLVAVCGPGVRRPRRPLLGDQLCCVDDFVVPERQIATFCTGAVWSVHISSPYTLLSVSFCFIVTRTGLFPLQQKTVYMHFQVFCPLIINVQQLATPPPSLDCILLCSIKSDYVHTQYIHLFCSATIITQRQTSSARCEIFKTLYLL